MAKGARASSRKRNNAALRATIFGPAHDARTQRLSARLQELVSQPKPAEEKDMLIDQDDAEEKEEKERNNVDIVDEMDVDGQKPASKPKHKRYKSKTERKKVHRKAKNSIVFPSRTRKSSGPGITKAKR